MWENSVSLWSTLKQPTFHANIRDIANYFEELGNNRSSLSKIIELYKNCFHNTRIYTFLSKYLSRFIFVICLYSIHRLFTRIRLAMMPVFALFWYFYDLHTCACMCMSIRVPWCPCSHQRSTCERLLSITWALRWNSGPQAWHQAPTHTEPSHC